MRRLLLLALLVLAGCTGPCRTGPDDRLDRLSSGELADRATDRSRPPSERRSAVRELGHRLDPADREADRRVPPVLIELLEDPVPEVRRAALKAVPEAFVAGGENRLDPAADEAVAALLEDPDPRVRIGAADVLIGLGRHRSDGPTGDPGCWQAGAAAALLRTGPPDDPRDGRIREVLGRGMTRDDPERRVEAMRALYPLGGDRGARRLWALPHLERNLAHRDRTVRYHAAIVLDAYGRWVAPVLETVLERLEVEPAAVVRGELASVLASSEVRSAAVRNALRARLEDRDAKVRVVAAGALVELDLLVEEAVAVVAEVIARSGEVPDPIRTIGILREAGPAARPAVPALCAWIRREGPSFRRPAALELLGALAPGDPRVVDVVTPLLEAEDRRVREAAAHLLRGASRAASRAG